MGISEGGRFYLPMRWQYGNMRASYVRIERKWNMIPIEEIVPRLLQLRKGLMEMRGYL